MYVYIYIHTALDLTPVKKPILKLAWLLYGLAPGIQCSQKGLPRSLGSPIRPNRPQQSLIDLVPNSPCLLVWVISNLASKSLHDCKEGQTHTIEPLVSDSSLGSQETLNSTHRFHKSIP